MVCDVIKFVFKKVSFFYLLVRFIVDYFFNGVLFRIV